MQVYITLFHKNNIYYTKILIQAKESLYLYSFEQGYDEFFKSYTFSVYNDGSIVTLDVPINYFKEQDDDDNQEDFPLKKRKRFVYGESIKKFKTEEESIQDARKEALKSYVTKNKKYMDRTDLNDAVPTGGEVIYLHKYDDGTYYTVVKFKKRDLKKFIKSFVKKEEPVVVETKEGWRGPYVTTTIKLLNDTTQDDTVTA